MNIRVLIALLIASFVSAVSLSVRAQTEVDTLTLFRKAEAGDGRALATLKTQATQGDARSQLELGSMYMLGVGVQKNYVEAIKWNRRAAGQGVPEAQINMGLMSSAGLGMKQDYELAAQWFRKAADEGNLWGQYFLARLYTEVLHPMDTGL